MPKRLRLDAMHERHYGLTPPLAGTYEEAAAVCFSRHHSSPVEVTLLDNREEHSAEMAWAAPDRRILAAWANETATTETGAYGCVLAGVEELRGLVAVGRAESGSGADFFVGPPGNGDFDLEDCLRLEVSGVSAGDQKEVTRRLRLKVEQVVEGRGTLPALAGVMGFSARYMVLQDVEEAP